jgi:Tfp pilus assembly protein PilF
MQALQIKIASNDRYAQASTYQNLGTVALEQRQWKKARDYLLKALEIDAAYEDFEYSRADLYFLAQLWQASGDVDLPAAIASILEVTPERAEALLHAASSDSGSGR